MFRLAARTSNGTDAWSCAISQLPSIFLKQNVARTPHAARCRPIVQRPTESAAAVRECDIASYSHHHIANVIRRILEERERSSPVDNFGLNPYLPG